MLLKLRWWPSACVAGAVALCTSLACTAEQSTTEVHTSPIVPAFSAPLPDYRKPLAGLTSLPSTENYIVYEAAIESGTYR
jgi:hypothetical protein